MGRTDARAGTGTQGFQCLLRAVGDGWCWAKLSGAHRISRNSPDYPTRGHFMKRWSVRIRNGWYGAATGRIRASRARCPMPDTCSNCFRCGRRTGDTAPHLVTNPAKLYGFPTESRVNDVRQ